jgi:hypothetical protein
MKLVFVFLLLIAAVHGQANACSSGPACQPHEMAVKLISTLKSNPNVKVMGSGMLIRSSRRGGTYIVTSEHVVLPCTGDEVNIEVIGESGAKATASVYKVNWEKGLALLKVHYTERFKLYHSRVPQVRDSFFWAAGHPMDAIGGRLSAHGFAQDSDTMASLRAKTEDVTRVFKNKDILRNQSIYGIKNMLATPGYSGAPVFEEGRRFVGMLSHVQNKAQQKSYVIPAKDVLQWVDNITVSHWQRVCREFKYSGGRASAFRNHMSVKVVKNGKDLFIEIPEGFRFYDDGKGYSPLDSFVVQMTKRQMTKGKICCGDNQGELSGWDLTKWMGYLLDGGHSLGLSLTEGTFGATDPDNSINEHIRPYNEKYVGTVTYNIKGVHKVRKRTLTYGTYVSWPLVDEEYTGWKSYSRDWESSSWVNFKRYLSFDKNPNPYSEQLMNVKLSTLAQWRKLYNNCEFKGGRKDRFVSGEGVSYNACVIDRGDRVTWYGPVPITGFLKIEYKFKRETVELQRIFSW